MNQISKRDYFLMCMNHSKYMELEWSIRAFSITEEPNMDSLMPYREADGWYFNSQEGGEKFKIADADPKAPLFRKQEPLTVEVDDFVGCTTAGQTTVTRVLWHHIMVVYPFGDKIPFKLEGRTITDVERIVAKNLVSNPTDGSEVPKDKISVKEHLMMTEAGGSLLGGLMPLFTTATTAKSLVTSPEVRKRREQLFKEKADQLHDPAVLAEIKGELIKLDKDYLAGDPSMEALAIDKKAFDQVRIKTLGTYGEESAFTDGTRVQVIPKSLDEGLDLDYIPEYSNGVRQASFNRGSETALGGELTQFLIRIFQNHTVDPTTEDCGTKGVVKRFIKHTLADTYVGLNVIDGGKIVTLTDDNLKKYVGTHVAMRTPTRCWSPGNTYCKTCLGEKNALKPVALGSLAVDVGNVIMYVFMKKAHGGALKTKVYDFEVDLY